MGLEQAIVLGVIVAIVVVLYLVNRFGKEKKS